MAAARNAHTDNDALLEVKRARNDQKLKSRFEDIFSRYEHDFTGVGYEIDIVSGEIIHLEHMRDDLDPRQSASASSQFANTSQNHFGHGSSDGTTSTDTDADVGAQDFDAGDEYDDSAEDAGMLFEPGTEIMTPAPSLGGRSQSLSGMSRPIPRMAGLLLRMGTSQRPIAIDEDDDTSSGAEESREQSIPTAAIQALGSSIADELWRYMGGSAPSNSLLRSVERGSGPDRKCRRPDLNAGSVESYEANTARPVTHMTKPMEKVRFSPAEDALIIKLKESDRLSWKAMAEHFRKRSAGSLQFRYSSCLRKRQSKSRALFDQEGVRTAIRRQRGRPAGSQKAANSPEQAVSGEESSNTSITSTACRGRGRPRKPVSSSKQAINVQQCGNSGVAKTPRKGPGRPRKRMSSSKQGIDMDEFATSDTRVGKSAPPGHSSTVRRLVVTSVKDSQDSDEDELAL